MQVRRAAAKGLAKMPANVRARFLRALAELEANAPMADLLDTQPVVGQPGYRRLRIGDWRAVFCRDSGGALVVTRAGPRGDVYKRM
jgi:mRNA interferase RelE/StbE